MKTKVAKERIEQDRTEGAKIFQDLINKPITSIADALMLWNEISAQLKVTFCFQEWLRWHYWKDWPSCCSGRVHENVIGIESEETKITIDSITYLAFLLNQIEQLKIERFRLLSEKKEEIENFLQVHQEVYEKEEEDLKKAKEDLWSFRQEIRRITSIIDVYIDSDAFPIQRNEEGEWVYSRTRLEFDHTKTFARKMVVCYLLGLVKKAVKMASNMKYYLLENKLSSWTNDIAEDISEIQTKMLILHEVFSFCYDGMPDDDDDAEWVEDRFLHEQHCADQFYSMKLGIEKIGEIEQFIYQDIFEEAKKRTNGNQTISRAVANAYWFQCLEWKLSIQLWPFIHIIMDWIQEEGFALNSCYGEFEVYDVEQEERRITRPYLLYWEIERDFEDCMFRMGYWMRNTNKSFPLYIHHLHVYRCTDTRNFVSDIRFYGVYLKDDFVWTTMEWRKKWKNWTDKFERQKVFLEQQIAQIFEETLLPLPKVARTTSNRSSFRSSFSSLPSLPDESDSSSEKLPSLPDESDSSSENYCQSTVSADFNKLKPKTSVLTVSTVSKAGNLLLIVGTIIPFLFLLGFLGYFLFYEKIKSWFSKREEEDKTKKKTEN